MKKNNKSLIVFNLEGIIDFVFGNENDGKFTDSEIVETYQKDEIDNVLKLETKQIREAKTYNDDTQKQTIKYDLVKTFISILSSVEDINNMSPIEKICFDTMLEKKLITIKDNKE